MAVQRKKKNPLLIVCEAEVIRFLSPYVQKEEIVPTRF